MTPKTQALLFRFLLIMGVVDLPIISAQLQQPTFDWKLLLAGVIGGAGAALEKSFSPQLADTILADATVMPPKAPPVPSPLLETLPPHA